MKDNSFLNWGIAPFKLLLPQKDIDLFRWSVIACDQHTANPAYWKEVERLVVDSPSTFYLTHPEHFLHDTDRTNRIHRTMQLYQRRKTLEDYGTQLVYIKRECNDGKIRQGIQLIIDLEAYSVLPGKKIPIRSSEKTIESRLKNRIALRENASIDLSHVLLLIDDHQDILIRGLQPYLGEKLYQTKLMLGGGNIEGYQISPDGFAHIEKSLETLSQSAHNFIMVGDGNHYLAAAKFIWEKKKKEGAHPHHPARFAMAEMVNLHDQGLSVESIARVIMHISDSDLLDIMTEHGRFNPESGMQEYTQSIAPNETIFWGRDHRGKIAWDVPNAIQCVWEVERGLEKILRTTKAEIHHVHGNLEAIQLARQSASIAILLPSIQRVDLFPTVEKYGSLPNKTFSIGSAEDKKYYLDARPLTE